jgi:hypothetical protein
MFKPSIVLTNSCGLCGSCGTCGACPGGIIPTSIALVAVDALLILLPTD